MKNRVHLFDLAGNYIEYIYTLYLFPRFHGWNDLDYYFSQVEYLETPLLKLLVIENKGLL